jgi:hypothetical protein
MGLAALYPSTCCGQGRVLEPTGRANCAPDDRLREPPNATGIDGFRCVLLILRATGWLLQLDAKLRERKLFGDLWQLERNCVVCSFNQVNMPVCTPFSRSGV